MTTKRGESRAIDLAREFLRSVIERAENEAVDRLPTARELAKMAGVSHPVMLSAVREKVVAGVLLSCRGRGISLARAIPPVSRRALTAGGRRLKWRDLAVRIERDIQDGAYAAGSDLPVLKTLAAEYGVGYRTLRAALGSLVRHGSLLSSKRGFVVREIEALHFRNSVILITRGDRLGNISEVTPRMHEQLRAMERECSERNLRLHTYTYDFEGTRLYPAARWRELAANEEMMAAVVGFIVWPIGLSQPQLHDLVFLLARYSRPVSVLDEGESFGVLPFPDQHAPVKLFAMAASPQAARAVGRFLLGLGHRSAVFVSPFQDTHWSRMRLRGLLQAFGAAGLDDGVRVVVTRRPEPIDKLESLSLRKALDRMTRVAEGCDSEADARLGRVIYHLRSRIALVVLEQVARDALAKLFHRVMREAPGASAWVCSNDYVAVEALEFLRSSGKKVPEEVSIVGFDDGLEAHLHKVSSYNFNGRTIVRAMLGHILDPERVPPGERSLTPVETDGFVVVRETTGRAPRVAAV